MRSKKRAFLLFISLLSVSGAALPVSAQGAGSNAAAAQALFDQAKNLVETGKYAEACPKYAESLRLDYGIATEFRLAECYKKVGKLASAWSHYVAVAEAAKLAGQAEREAVARKEVQDILPRLPKLALVVSDVVKRIDGLEVKQDGIDVGQPTWGDSLPVDPGEHVIDVTAPKKKPWQKKVTVAEGVSERVVIDRLEDAPVIVSSIQSGAGTIVSSKEERESSGLAYRVGAISAAAVGVGGVVVGSIFGAIASSKWSEADSGCPDAMKANKECSPEIVSKGQEAYDAATVSTVAFAVGGVALGAAGILWFMSPSSKQPSPAAGWRLAPTISPDSFGGIVQARF